MKVLWEGKLPVMICPRDTKPYRLVLRKVDNHLRVLGDRHDGAGLDTLVWK